MKATCFSRFTVHLPRCFIVCAVVAILLISHASAQIVEIPDPNLERAIREELELSSEFPITQREMLNLFSLRAADAQIENLTGLEYAHNLESLAIPHNPINNLTPIADLRQLEYLFLAGIPIEDLTFLKDLTQLKHLNLFACNITDITPLQNLRKLLVLDLQANRIKDISPLSNLTALETLRLQHNYIVDISPLANLTELKELNLQDNQINNMEVLANLTRLERLWIYTNPIFDFSPIQGLSLTEFGHDEECLLSDIPVKPRLENRSLPSVFNGWIETLLNRPRLSEEDQLVLHDLFWQRPRFGLRFQDTPDGYQVLGEIERTIAERKAILAKNPNMIFLCEIRQRSGHVPGHYPKDWFGWLRDHDGNPIRDKRAKDPNIYLIDMTNPDVQDVIVQQAIAVSKCGLYDGIFFDWWLEKGGSLRDFSVDPAPFFVPPEAERDARLSILQRIRANVPDDFLIVCNQTWQKYPISAPYINGGLVETFHGGGYTNDLLAEIEDTMIWLEENLREPQIICLRGEGLSPEPGDSPANKQWMRFFTTMSLTLSDGYTLYTYPGGHFWYDFWDADLGQPIAPLATPYQGVPSLYIREFTNGWAVYNRSGQAQTVTLPSSATSVSDRGNNAASITHLLPDLDGEIYIATRSFADVNRDGKVNILDLVQVVNGFGKNTPHVNRDGGVNILDLVFVSRYFSAEE